MSMLGDQFRPELAQIETSTVSEIPEVDVATGEVILGCPSCKTPLVSLLELRGADFLNPDGVGTTFTTTCPRCVVKTFNKKFPRNVKISFQAIRPFIIIKMEDDGELVKLTLKEVK